MVKLVLCNQSLILQVFDLIKEIKKYLYFCGAESSVVYITADFLS